MAEEERGGGSSRICVMSGGGSISASFRRRPGPPSMSSATDSRRRYVSLRRRLMVHPHLPKEEDSDNPLSQNPDSSWGHFFRGAELEKTVDRDLSRLYPEDDIQVGLTECGCASSDQSEAKGGIEEVSHWTMDR